MPSVSAHIRVAALAVCLVLIGAAFGGCETTQEKAEKQQARATHILKARDERRREKKQDEKSQRHHGKDDQKGKKQ